MPTNRLLTDSPVGDETLALDWSSLGQWIRACAVEQVAKEFAQRAVDTDDMSGSALTTEGEA